MRSNSYYCLLFCIFSPHKNLLSCSYLICAYCWLFSVYCVSPHFLGFTTVYKCKKSQGFLTVLAKLDGKSKLQTIF